MLSKKINCKVCNKIIYCVPSSKRKYCSNKCKFKTYKGKGNPFYGKKHKKETNEINKEKHLGNIPWNKDLTKETDERVGKGSNKQTLTMRRLVKEGKICQPWKKPMSKKGRKNISIGGKNFHKENPDFQNGKKNPMYGKENKWGFHTEKTKQLIGKKKIGVPNPKNSILCSLRTGKKANNWQGGKSFEPYSIDFNRQLKLYIRQKYNYICQLCFKKENKRKHDVHHIDYDKKNCNEDNLILLCRSCNGKANGNRNYWLNYFRGDSYFLPIST